MCAQQQLQKRLTDSSWATVYETEHIRLWLNGSCGSANRSRRS